MIVFPPKEKFSKNWEKGRMSVIKCVLFTQLAETLLWEIGETQVQRPS